MYAYIHIMLSVSKQKLKVFYEKYAQGNNLAIKNALMIVVKNIDRMNESKKTLVVGSLQV